MDYKKANINFMTEVDVYDTLGVKSIADANAKLQQDLRLVAKAMDKSLEPLREMAKTLSPALSDLAKITQNFSSAVEPAIEAFRQWIEPINELSAQWKIPTVSDARKQELISSHTTWGQYGWTFLPDDSTTCFYELPKDIKEANDIMKKRCSKLQMSYLFDELRSMNIKKVDLDAAIVCYDNRQYKACALILFSMIDEKLIRRQKRGSNWRLSGEKAVKELRRQFESSSGSDILSVSLYCTNLCACLETLFAKANDFKNEFATINRNFLAHGMSRRPVRQRDCIQLFLALYNLTTFFSLVS